jgi:hypothetical protein
MSLHPPLSQMEEANSITHHSITSHELDGNLDKYLQDFRDNGHAEKYGAILIERLPLSKFANASHCSRVQIVNIVRARIAANSSSTFSPPLSVASFKPKTRIAGCYILVVQPAFETFEWVAEVESSVSQKDGSVFKFSKFLDGEESFGTQCQSLKGN